MLTPGTKLKYRILESKGKGRRRIKERNGVFLYFNDSLPDRLVIRKQNGTTVLINRRDIVEVGI